MSKKRELEKLGEKITNKDIKGSTTEKLLKSIADNYEGGTGVVFAIDELLFTQLITAFYQQPNEGVTLTEGTIFNQTMDVIEKIKNGQIPQMNVKISARANESGTQMGETIFTFAGTKVNFLENDEFTTETPLIFHTAVQGLEEIQIAAEKQNGETKVTIYIYLTT